MILFLALLAIFALAFVAGMRGFWRAADALQAERDRVEGHAARIAAAWHEHPGLEQIELLPSDFREAGWSDARVRAFLGEHFPGRERVRCEELRPFLDDVLVRDVLAYRSLRRAAAERYEAIRHTWVNVEDLERDGRLPPELRPLVCERERQSGRLILAGDLLPFVGRPIVRELLEKKLADTAIAPRPG